jgi:hopanoid biosynthesis associated RND transporter like protein HpnN
MTQAHGALGRWLAVLVGGVVRRPYFVVIATLMLVAICGRYAVDRLGINTDTANMISPTLAWRQDFIAYRDAFPARDRNIIVAVEADDAATAATAAAELAAAVEARPDQFVGVFLAGYGEFFDRNGLLYLPIEALDQLSDRLVAAQPLIGQLGEGFSGSRVLAVAQLAMEQTAENSSARLGELDALLVPIAAAIEATAEGRSAPINWNTLIRQADLAELPTAGTRQLLLLRPVLDFDRLQPAREAIETLRQLSDQIAVRHGNDIRMRLTGTVAMEHEELVSVTRSAATAGVAALLLVLIVLFWALRSLRLLLVAFLTLAVGLVFTAAFAGFAVGHLNLISVAFAVLYVGLGVDFILHFCLRLKELTAAGERDVTAALEETARGVGASLVICAVTTAAGFYAFIPTDFDGVSELGLISGSGMFISLAVSITLLPALLRICWRPPADAITPRSLRLSFPQISIPRARSVAAAAAILAVGSLLLLPGLEFDSNPIHLRNPETESVALLNELAASSEAPIFSMTAIADDRASGSSWATALRDEPLVASVQTVESLVPAGQPDKQLLLEDLQFVLGPGFADFVEEPFDAPELTDSMGSLARALGTASETTAMSRLRMVLETWSESNAGLTAVARTERLQLLDGSLRSDLTDQLTRLDKSLTAREFTSDDLPAALRDRWIAPDGRELVEIVPVEDLNDNAAAARFVSAVRGVIPRATGLPVVYQEASATIVGAFSEALTYALLAISALLVLLLRRIGDVVLVLVPIIFAALLTAAVAIGFDLPLNFANVIALPLLIGVGVDNGIHMVHRMRTDPPADGHSQTTSTSRAVLASGLTTIASFGNLAYSEHLGMASMGQLLTIGMVVTLLATLVLLPALIRLRAGR